MGVLKWTGSTNASAKSVSAFSDGTENQGGENGQCENTYRAYREFAYTILQEEICL